MRIGIDAREIQSGVFTGIGRPLANFLTYVAQQRKGDQYILFSSRKIPIDFGPTVVNRIVPQQATFLWDQWQLPKAIKSENIDVFYSPYYKIPLIKHCPTLSAILDLMYLEFKPYYDQMPWFKKMYYKIMGRVYVARADKILTCSEYSKRDIHRLYGVDPSKIITIPLSVGDIYRPERGRSPVGGDYLLYVGNFKPHKNVSVIIDAFARIASEFKSLKLVLAGPKEFTYPELKNQVEKHNLQDRVVFLGKVTEEDQPHLLYSDAKVFVMPSLYEGFGLPPLEAMACGVPVVASNTTSIPEVVGNAGLLVDPTDVSAVANAIKTILIDDHLSRSLSSQGQQRAREYQNLKVSAELYSLIASLSK